MFNELAHARKTVVSMTDTIVNDPASSPREKEVWNEIPYLFKLSQALAMEPEKSNSLLMQAVRGIVGVGAYITMMGNEIRSPLIVREIRALKKIMEKSR